MIYKLYRKFEIITASLRVHPQFLIIGAQKAGTSSLYSLLKTHPQVVMPRVKEIHFFDLQYEKGIRFYQHYFQTTIKKQFVDLLKGKCITGEATPLYLFHPAVPERVFKHYPSIKLVVILRDPYERAVSHYNHNVRVGRESRSLNEALLSDLNRKQELIHDKPDMFHFSYLERGLYYDQLERWLAYFSREKLLILDFEKLISSSEHMAKSVYSFLEIDNIPSNMPKKNIGTYKGGKVEVDTRFIDFFKDDVRKLRDILKLNFGWFHKYD